ncbi:response regulator transcription factor [Brasilonema sp. UFV-L1]|uniref:response regulator transcription factor n=1 Tax=Brasilonema sp. UFV-L1 TaxID=2234130 RepID=UPI00145D8032|nr:response regulator transcription factor [Brasilonema sp. UFV-L1]NMG07580.1 response regulator [Brasilonema sp. UFV-L1]
MNQVLIVEDEARLAAFVEKGLRKNGFSTAVAADGEQAIHMAENSHFDLILLDLKLPIKDGWTVLRELRRNQSKQFPIIIMTAMSDEQNKTAALKNGANDYITKPFSFKDLLERVRTQLD